VFLVTLTCSDAEDKDSSASTTVTVNVEHDISSPLVVAPPHGCTVSDRESEFFVAENMLNVTLGRLRCRHKVFCQVNKRCSLTVIGALSSITFHSLHPHLHRSLAAAIGSPEPCLTLSLLAE